MHSRSYMFLERDYVLLQRNPAWGIEAHPLNEDNFFEWTATIQGLKDTIWEGGTFVVSLKFPDTYSDVPPTVHFHTIPFHPNIDMATGRPCVDFLDDFNIWKDAYSLHFILLSLQFLLANPVLENPINVEAATIFQSSPDVYRNMVVDCVRASQKLFGDRSSTADQVQFDASVSMKDQMDEHSTSQIQSKVSFDEYLTTWSGIATSKPQVNMKNPLLEAIKRDTKLQAAHFGLSLEELQQQMRKQLNEHNAIMYGNFGPKGKGQSGTQEDRLNHINKMRKIYLPKRSVPPPSTAHSEVDDPWDREADDLLAWTSTLDEGDLE